MNPITSLDLAPTFELLLETNPTAIAISKLADGRYLMVNDAFVNLVGYRRDELTGHTANELGLWNNPAERDEWITIIKAQGHAQNLAAEYRCKSGELMPGIKEYDRGLIQASGRVASGGHPEKFETYVRSLQEWLLVSVLSLQRGELGVALRPRLARQAFTSNPWGVWWPRMGTT